LGKRAIITTQLGYHGSAMRWIPDPSEGLAYCIPWCGREKVLDIDRKYPTRAAMHRSPLHSRSAFYKTKSSLVDRYSVGQMSAKPLLDYLERDAGRMD